MYVLLCVVPHAALLSSGMNQTEPNRTTTTNKRQRQWMILLPFDQTLLRVFALMTRQIVPPPPPYANRLVGNQLERLQQQWNDRPTKTATLFLYRTQFEKRSCTGDSLSCRILLETFGSILSIFNFPKNFSFSSSSSVEYCNRFSKYSSKHESSLELDIFCVDKQKRNEQGVNLTTTIGNCKFNCIFLLSKIKQTI